MSIETEPSPEEVKEIVRSMKTVAVLGAHASETRPAHYVPEALHKGGIRVLPVNERYAGSALFDNPVRATLAELGEPVDVVDVFRRPDALDGHIDDILAMSPRPKVVWLQSGIVNHDFAARLRSTGITVVQDRCLMVEFRKHADPPS